MGHLFITGLPLMPSATRSRLVRPPLPISRRLMIYDDDLTAGVLICQDWHYHCYCQHAARSSPLTLCNMPLHVPLINSFFISLSRDDSRLFCRIYYFRIYFEQHTAQQIYFACYYYRGAGWLFYLPPQPFTAAPKPLFVNYHYLPLASKHQGHNARLPQIS